MDEIDFSVKSDSPSVLIAKNYQKTTEGAYTIELNLGDTGRVEIKDFVNNNTEFIITDKELSLLEEITPIEVQVGDSTLYKYVSNVPIGTEFTAVDVVE